MPTFCLVSGLNTHGKWEEAGNEIRSWSHAMGGDVYYGHGIEDYTIFDKYDITMIELKDSMLSVAKSISMLSSTKLVGLTEGDLMNRDWHSTTYAKYIDVLNRVDLVGIINDKAYDIMKCLTIKPVRMIGIPYPLEWASSNQLGKLEYPIVELGSTPTNRGGIWTLATFNQLGVKGIVYTEDTSDIESTIKMSNGLLTIGFNTDWQNYYREHSRYHMGLHLDDRATWGRFPLDCASAGMPCISTKGSYTQEILFPDLTVDYYDVRKAIELTNRLLKDKSFFDYSIQFAQEKIKQFDLQPTKDRFIRIMEEI